MLAYFHSQWRENQVKSAIRCESYHFKAILHLQGMNHYLWFLSKPKKAQLFGNDSDVNIVNDTIFEVFKNCLEK